MAVSLNTALGAYPITALAGTTYVPLAGGTMTGALTLPAGSAAAPSLLFTGAGSGDGFFSDGAAQVSASIGGAKRLYITDGGVYALTNLGVYDNNSSLIFGTSLDIRLFRDAAATLAQRNGTNAQTLRVYNTWTDASNGEWGSFGWSGNTLEITSNAIGTGSHRPLRLAAASSVFVGSTLSSVYLYTGSTHVVVVNPDSIEMRQPVLHSSYEQFTEMTAPAAPATNSVRIYAEDNGSGKTRLMALFATGSAVQLGIEP